jgi:predicted histidine transporter YuiF (NhaC family)
LYIDANTIIKAGSLLTALGIIIGLFLKAYGWYLKQEAQDAKIKALEEKHDKETAEMKEENRLVCEALVACLDGLQQLGANHNVPKAKGKLETYLNAQAHK